jgi:hypothetical protein
MPRLWSSSKSGVKSRFEAIARWASSKKGLANYLVSVTDSLFNLLKHTEWLFSADSEIALTNEKGTAVVYNIKFRLHIDDDFMRTVEDDIRRLNSTGALTAVSGRFGSVAALAQAGNSALTDVGTVVKPLGEALQAFVKVMDGIADVRSLFHSI